MHRNRHHTLAIIFCMLAARTLIPTPAPAEGSFGSEEVIQAGGIDIDVPGFSVPSLVRWNGDALPDLVVGEGGLGIDDGRIRVYLNTGSAGAPVFGGFFYVQSNGADLVSPSSG